MTRLEGPLGKLEKELAELEEKSAGMTRNWQAEKDKIAASSKLKEELEAGAHAAGTWRNARVTLPKPVNWPIQQFPNSKRS